MASVLSYESLNHAVAGAVGSMTAETRLQLQVDEKRKSKITHMVLLEIIKKKDSWHYIEGSMFTRN
uniref:Uncharacterized protein n=1 Tax=Aotus nancymaae TaxID=37293 RepID=A0A2K5CK30_AOTNA